MVVEQEPPVSVQVQWTDNTENCVCALLIYLLF